MMLERALHVLQRQQQRLKQLKAIDLRGRIIQRRLNIELRILPLQKLLQLGDACSLDRLASDRTLKNIMSLVGRVDRQLKRKTISDVDVRKNALLALLADALPLDRV